MSRVYPTSSGKSYSGGKDEVDMMVHDIEEDIKRFTRGNDEMLRDVFGKKAGGQLKPNTNITRPNSVSLATSSNLPLITQHNETSSSHPEEVKLSHEIAYESENREGNKKLADDLHTKFTVLTQQIKEYQSLNASIAKKLKASETKVSELETKVDTLEEEAQELRTNGGSSNSNQSGLYAVRVNNNNRNAQFNKDINKRTEQMRKALLSGENEEMSNLNFNDLIASRNFYKMLKAWFAQYLPFKRDLRTVQARFGTSVASYFVFQRFVFLKISFVAVVMAAFAVIHLAMFYQNPTGTLSGYIQGPGYLPKFMTFSSFRVKERFIYSAVVVLTMVFITSFLCASIVAEHKNAITMDALDSENSAPFSKEVLCAWDLSLSTAIDIDDLRGKNEHTYLQLLEDSHESGQKKARSRYESFVSITRRVFGIFCYLVVVSGSFTAIIYLTVYGSIISDRAKDIPGVNNIGTLIAPIALQAINAIVPMLLQAITAMEHWDSAQTELRFLLFRTYLSNTLNTLILTLSYIILMDPFLLAQYPYLRRSLQLVRNDRFSCRIDQVADGLFTLVGATWAIQLATFFANPLGEKMLSVVRGKPWVKTEFHIAESMVNKLSFLGLVFVAFPFAPLAMVFVPFYLFITFKWEKFVIKRYYAKPKRPFRGQQAALLYAIFYLATYVLVGISASGYFLSTKTMTKDCSIQDDYVHMCADEVDSTTNICTVDDNSQFYRFWGENGDYPAVICEEKCGPFVNDRSVLSAFKDPITGTGTLSQIWDAIFVYPYIPWFLVVVLALVVSMRVNAHEVSRFSSTSKEKMLENQIQAIDAERKRQEKIILKLKTIEEEEEEGDEK